MATAIAGRTLGNAWTRRLRLYWKALLLQGEVYREVVDASAPRKEGFRLLAVLFLTVGVLVSLGLALGWLTLPRIDLLQASVSESVFESQAYQAWAAASPTGALLFNAFYQVFWFLLTIEVGYPSARDIVLGPLSMLGLGLFRWATFAIFGEWVARRLGGTARPHAFWAALALAAAPALLRTLTVVPGLYLPGGLMVAWLALTSYQAVRATYPTLTWRQCLAVELWMFALHFICIILAVVFGVVLGVVLYQMIL
jgi:hypothetical protein